MLLRWFVTFSILFAYVLCMARGSPLHLENTLLDADESNEVLTEIQLSNHNVVKDAIVKVSIPYDDLVMQASDNDRDVSFIYI